MSAQFIAAARRWLSTECGLGDDHSRQLARVAQRLVSNLPETGPCCVAISGAPGTGKSTLAGAIVAARPDALSLSLDDYYLPLEQRQQLARNGYPRLARRGLPGTHDIDLLCEHLGQLRRPEHPRLVVPRFDKARDDRASSARIIEAGPRPRLLLVEGWMIGVPPPGDSIEAQGLSHYYRRLEGLIDRRWHLAAPGWRWVVEWRWRQEQALPEPWLKDLAAVEKFLDDYRWLCQHMQDSCHQWSDAVVRLDERHRPSLADAA